MSLIGEQRAMRSRQSIRFRVLIFGCWLTLHVATGLAESPHWESVGLAGTSLWAVEAHPEDPRILLAGGGPNGSDGMWRSTDGGDSWQQINTGLGTIHRVNAIVFIPCSPGADASQHRECTDSRLKPSSTVLIGVLNADGPPIFRSTDMGDHWEPLSNGLPISYTEVTSIVVEPLEPDTIYAGLNDSTGGVVKSIDGGDTWEDSSAGLADGYCGDGCVLDLAIHPTRSNVLYASIPVLFTVFKTTDAGLNWVPTGTSPQPEELALHPLRPSTIYMTGSVPGWGGFVKTTDGGETWTDLTSMPGLPPPIFLSFRAIVVHPSRPDFIWMVTEDGMPLVPVEAVYASTDGGLSWVMADDGLEGVRVGNLAYSNGWVLAATDDGVYRRRVLYFPPAHRMAEPPTPSLE